MFLLSLKQQTVSESNANNLINIHFIPNSFSLLKEKYHGGYKNLKRMVCFSHFFNKIKCIKLTYQ